MADNPAFAVYPEIGNGLVTVLNNTRDGVSGSGYVVFASGNRGGTRIAEIVVQCTGVTVAGLARVYLSGIGINGNPLFDEITITAVAAPSASVKTHRISTTYNNLVLQSGQVLNATNSIGPTQGFNIIALGADL